MSALDHIEAVDVVIVTVCRERVDRRFVDSILTVIYTNVHILSEMNNHDIHRHIHIPYIRYDSYKTFTQTF